MIRCCLLAVVTLSLTACRNENPHSIAHPESGEPTKSGPQEVGGRPLTETQKIEHLIRRIEALDGAVFIRNGREHDGDEAALHMRKKWRWRMDRIATARDFIREAASQSSISGQPYFIRLKDGSEISTRDFLLAELEQVE